MVKTAYLRVYQPIEVFPAEERERWPSHSAENNQAEDAASRRWLIAGALPAVESARGLTEGVFVREVEGAILVCPWRTRLRMLAGLIAFRGSVPEEVADAFVPEDSARRAAAELQHVGEHYPDVRSHIVHANWHVPLRWFSAFDDSERILTEDAGGLRIRYETSIRSARRRLARSLEILDASWIDEVVTSTVQELSEWLEEFDDRGLLELDYGSVARMFADEELVDDHTAAEVWTCLDALEKGDVVLAGKVFTELSEAWADRRSLEAIN